MYNPRSLSPIIATQQLTFRLGTPLFPSREFALPAAENRPQIPLKPEFVAGEGERVIVLVASSNCTDCTYLKGISPFPNGLLYVVSSDAETLKALKVELPSLWVLRLQNEFHCRRMMVPGLNMLFE